VTFTGDRRDVLSGDDGNDRILGDDGSDSLEGGSDLDTQVGSIDNDTRPPNQNESKFFGCRCRFAGYYATFRTGGARGTRPAPRRRSLRVSRAAQAFAEKLRIVAVILECGTCKELCAAFRAADPRTQFEVDRVQKWLQGRALPRSGQVMAEIARILGVSQGGAWVAACSPREFLEAAAQRRGVDTGTLARMVSGWGGGEPQATPRKVQSGNHHHLLGCYACYSPAWSPYFAGQLIRGTLVLEASDMAIAATYTETLLGRRVPFEGSAVVTGRSIHLDMREATGGLPVFMSTYLPGPPASVLCGVMAGVVAVAHEAQPTAGRIVAVRVRDAAAAAATERYMPAEPAEIGADLAALGLHLAAPSEVGAAVCELLAARGGVADQVSIDDQARLTRVLDMAHLAARAVA
jgi:hypothetical protein